VTLGNVSGSVTFSSGTPVSFVLNGNETWTQDATNWIFTTAGQNWTFNDSSYNSSGATVTGNATFNDSSFNAGNVNGTATYNGFTGTNFIGTFTNGQMNRTLYGWGLLDSDWNNLGNWFMDDGLTIPAPSLPTSIDSVVISLSQLSENSGSTPTVVNLTVNNVPFGLPINVTGTATFNGSSANLAAPPGSDQATLTANCVFNDGAYINTNATVNGNCTFNNESRINGGYVNGDCVFNDSAYNDYGWIAGNATFNDSSYNNYGRITGDATFNDYSHNDLYGDIANATFNDSSYNNSGATVTGNATFNDSSYNNGTVSGDATFNDYSYNSSSGDGVTGDATFNDNSTNNFNGTARVGGLATFTKTGEILVSSSSLGFLESNYYAGGISIPNASSLVFDVDYTGLLPISFAGQWIFSDGNNAGTITANVIFNGNSMNYGTINGDVTFNDTSKNGDYQYSSSIYGNVTFNGSSFNGFLGVIDSNTTVLFNDSSYNDGNVTGDATFNDSSYNNGTVTGDATFNDSSYTEGGTISGNAMFTLDSAALTLTKVQTIYGSISFTYEKGINGSSILGII
jgi:hypothetical protein